MSGIIPCITGFEKKYTKAIELFTKHSLPVVITSFAVVVIVVVFGARSIGTEFLPELDQGAFNIRCFFPVGITLQNAAVYCPVIRNVISNHKQVNVVLTQLGRNDDGTDPYGPNRLEILVGLKDYSTWTKDTSKEQLLEKIKYELQQAVPGAEFSFSQPILDNVTEAVTGSVADLAVLIDGQGFKFYEAKSRFNTCNY